MGVYTYRNSSQISFFIRSQVAYTKVSTVICAQKKKGVNLHTHDFFISFLGYVVSMTDVPNKLRESLLKLLALCATRSSGLKPTFKGTEYAVPLCNPPFGQSTPDFVALGGWCRLNFPHKSSATTCHETYPTPTARVQTRKPPTDLDQNAKPHAPHLTRWIHV